MAKLRQNRRRAARGVLPWWRPLAYSAATATVIAALFNPLPAVAVPVAPPGAPAAVPDAGSRPIATGSLTLPGQRPGTSASTTPASTLPVATGGATSPLLRKIEAGRIEIAKKGEELAKLDEDLSLTRTQLTTADQKVLQGQSAVTAAEQAVAAAAANAVRHAAALPPGTAGSGLNDLDALARIQRGESSTQEAASRHLSIAQSAYTTATTEQQSLRAKLDLVTAEHTKKKAVLDKKTAAQQKLEQKHTEEIKAAEAAQAARDAQAGVGFLAGENAGRGADPRAIAALQIALAQRGDPYVWSEEGPDMFDCSGLMYYAYRSDAAGNFPLTRVAKDQYFQTRDKTVDRYSLLPGDLLFFNSTPSWTSIHHVAMYAGKGMMVEAPRAGMDVMLTPMRWTQLFAATRIYGSVEGKVEGPKLGAPDPEKPSDHSPTPKPGTKPPTKPSDPGTPSTPGKPSTGRPSTPSTGTPSTGTPSTGTPSTGTPSTGTPSTGTPTTGTPTTSGRPSTPTGGSNPPSGSAGTSTGAKPPSGSTGTSTGAKPPTGSASTTAGGKPPSGSAGTSATASTSATAGSTKSPTTSASTSKPVAASTSAGAATSGTASVTPSASASRAAEAKQSGNG
ncbi:C40 family peptidase [Couchioplanes caeruleus]|uniref:NlpC/P60 domain-containing protein n=1 Tax=Couchioplanes caeruleus subsp. caeruleus TaxID=56427 RepID=A0A1K0FR07_9ACTN|nr:NlpC/P60 family protein [Couchioplanes caeruleus]OJF15271.1 hypothetical protein BG844_05240 [Couchioplanes caeruleus subsp. caeruleus]